MTSRYQKWTQMAGATLAVTITAAAAALLVSLGFNTGDASGVFRLHLAYLDLWMFVFFMLVAIGPYHNFKRRD